VGVLLGIWRMSSRQRPSHLAEEHSEEEHSEKENSEEDQSEEEGAEVESEDDEWTKAQEDFDFANKDVKKWKLVARNRGIPEGTVMAHPPSTAKEWKERVDSGFYTKLVSDGGEKWLPLCMSRSMGYMLAHNLRKKYNGAWDQREIQAKIETKYPDMLVGGVIPNLFLQDWNKTGEALFTRCDQAAYSIKLQSFITQDFDVMLKVMEKLDVHGIMSIIVVSDENRGSHHAVVGLGRGALDITPDGHNAYSVGRQNFRQLLVVDTVASQSRTRKAPELQSQHGWEEFFDAALQISKEPVEMDLQEELAALRAYKEQKLASARVRANVKPYRKAGGTIWIVISNCKVRESYSTKSPGLGYLKAGSVVQQIKKLKVNRLHYTLVEGNNPSCPQSGWVSFSINGRVLLEPAPTGSPSVSPSVSPSASPPTSPPASPPASQASSPREISSTKAATPRVKLASPRDKAATPRVKLASPRDKAATPRVKLASPS